MRAELPSHAATLGQERLCLTSQNVGWKARNIVCGVHLVYFGPRGGWPMRPFGVGFRKHPLLPVPSGGGTSLPLSPDVAHKPVACAFRPAVAASSSFAVGRIDIFLYSVAEYRRLLLEQSMDLISFLRPARDAVACLEADRFVTSHTITLSSLSFFG